jgi:hypothetical protein
MRIASNAMNRPEQLLLAGGALLLLAALALPGVAQPAHYHEFADQRTLFGLPHACDVLSNLGFALAGLLGLWALHGVHVVAMSGVQRDCARLFFVGLLVTALGSSWYHLAPDHLGLAVDRASMSVAFAGILGLATAARVNDRAGRLVAQALLVAGPLAVAWWYFTANVLPWALLQGGGMVLLLVATFAPARTGEIAVRWGWALCAYAIAKLLELGDHVIYEATGQLLSGHTLKHLVAALAAWPVIAVVWTLGRGQNASDPRPGARMLRDTEQA